MAAWSFFDLWAVADNTLSMETVQPTNTVNILIVHNKNMVRLGKRVTTTAAMPAFINPQH